MDLDKYFSEKRQQREGKIPSDADMQRFKSIQDLLNKGGDAARTVSNEDKKFYKSLLKKITGGRTTSDADAEPMMDGGKVRKKKKTAKNMMSGGKVYSRGSRKANYNA